MIRRYATSVIGLAVLVGVTLRLIFFSSLIMSGSAMLPTIEPGEYILANHRVVPRRDRVVVLRCPGVGAGDSDRTCLSRVVAIEGDRVEYRDARLYVNERPIEPATPGPEDTRTPPLIVPPGSVFVLNDRRADVQDSRTWGALPIDRLEGRVLFIWLSLDWFTAEAEVRSWPKVRWSRTFRSIH